MFAIGVIWLFKLNRERKNSTSPALWIPGCWFLIAGSRMVSEWLSVDSAITSPDQYLDGSPLDRAILMALLIVGVGVLVSRKPRVAALLAANWPVVFFFAYCAISTTWSDFMLVSLKRWSKSVGDLVMVLLILTDPCPMLAVRRFFTRIGLILLPASILLIKYYPEWGRGYDRWVGTAMYTGVTSNKNLLGVVCLTTGLACAWQVLQLIQTSPISFKNKRLVAQGSLLLMALWLLWRANSATSKSCFAIGCTVMILTSVPLIRRNRMLIHLLVIGILAVAFSALFLDIGSSLVKSLDRDPTLTGRTDVWESVIALAAHPLIGTGFESFWLGERLEKLWAKYWWHPNEAHNGYIEVYLNLGWLGLTLLAVAVLTAYRAIIKGIRQRNELAALRLAYIVAALAYSFTEAGFRMMHPLWICLLFAMVSLPSRASKKTSPVSESDVAVLEVAALQGS